ncbi:MAG: hypothetical protein V8S89_01425 [Oscillospiraceae bacterium]
MADAINARANTRLQTVFFFMVCYAPFQSIFGCVSTLSASYQKRHRNSPAKVQGKCHKSATTSVLNSCAPISAQQSGSQDICGRRSMQIKCKEQVHSALAWAQKEPALSSLTAHLSGKPVHTFPSPFAKASHFAP